MNKWMRSALSVMMIVSVFAVAGCDSQSAIGSEMNKITAAVEQNTGLAKTDTAAKAQEQTDKTSQMLIYIPTEDGSGVRAQAMTVDTVKKTIKFAVSEVLRQDSEQKHPVFAKGTEVTNVTLDGSNAVISLSKEFLTGATSELTAQLRLAAIVDTATEFSGVKTVTFVVNGKPIKTYGSYDLSKPLSRMTNIIKK